MSAYFVTSTGTDIGKTFVVRGLIKQLSLRGRTVEALKPVITGFDPRTAHASDTGRLLSALGRALTPEHLAEVSPYRLREPGYAALPVQKAKAFTKAAGLSDAQSPIVPVVIGEEEATLAASRMLAEEGYLAAAIRPPTVPPGTARLRLTFTAQHPDDRIARLADIVRDKILHQ